MSTGTRTRTWVRSSSSPMFLQRKRRARPGPSECRSPSARYRSWYSLRRRLSSSRTCFLSRDTRSGQNLELRVHLGQVFQNSHVDPVHLVLQFFIRGEVLQQLLFLVFTPPVTILILTAHITA